MRVFIIFFFNDTATTEIYTLSLHDALPILPSGRVVWSEQEERLFGLEPGTFEGSIEGWASRVLPEDLGPMRADRKSTRLNSSHANISYAVFCLKKKKN